VTRNALVGILIAVFTACATISPERALEDDLMWEAARECKARYATILSIDRIDHYGRLNFTFLGSGPDNAAFLQCYQVGLAKKFEANADRLGVGRLSPSTRTLGKMSVPVSISGTSAYVTAVLNDAERATLLLDTGATNTVITPTLAKKLGIAPPTDARVRIANLLGGKTLEVPFVRLRTLQVGAAVVEDLQIGVYDIVPHLAEVTGILGTDFLRHFRTSLDPGARSLTLEVVVPRASTPVTTPSTRTLDVPVWKVGDEWNFRWDSPRGSGTYVSVVTREESANGFDCYVVRTGRREAYYRKTDLAFVLEKLNSEIEQQARPPALHFVWPLSVGRTWDEAYTTEWPRDQRTRTHAFISHVETEETISVPAGTFATFKMVRRLTPGDAVNYEAWYSPDVKRWIRLRQPFEHGLRTTEITAFKVN
jgi:Aspartyl protease